MTALRELRNHPVFLGHAKAETMLRDFDRLRVAIRAHDSFAAEEAWDQCDRWVDQLKPLTEVDMRATIDALIWKEGRG